jgi:hypothetical protein
MSPQGVERIVRFRGSILNQLQRWSARGVRYVHAPVFMAPANCAEGTGWMLISGDPVRHEALQPARTVCPQTSSCNPVALTTALQRSRSLAM